MPNFKVFISFFIIDDEFETEIELGKIFNVEMMVLRSKLRDRLRNEKKLKE